MMHLPTDAFLLEHDKGPDGAVLVMIGLTTTTSTKPSASSVLQKDFNTGPQNKESQEYVIRTQGEYTYLRPLIPAIFLEFPICGPKSIPFGFFFGRAWTLA